jgi:hypothetical protein
LCWWYNRRKQQLVIFGSMLKEQVTKKPLTFNKLTRETF